MKSNQLVFGIDLIIDPLWYSWFSGLIDGEGSFLIAINKHKTKESANCYIQLKLREDDSKVLREILKTIKCGRIYHYDYGSARLKGEKSMDQLAWICYKNSDLKNIIIPMLDMYQLHSKKISEYMIWREAIILVTNENKYDLQNILLLKRRMEECRKSKFIFE